MQSLAAMVQAARDGGIHGALAVLSEWTNLEGLRFVLTGRELPHEPFGTEMYFDWMARVSGDRWPDPRAD